MIYGSLSVFEGLLLLSNILNAVKIEKLVVPELVQIGNVSEITLHCDFKTMNEGPYSVEWLFNERNVPIYRWNSYSPAKVNGILVDRLDLTFHVSSSVYDKGSILRLVRLDPQLSGDYTCSVTRNGTTVQQTKTMLVFSPERELDLEVRSRSQKSYDVMCTARGVFPQPDLILEYNNKLIPKQHQRIWRSGAELTLYDAESITQLEASCPGTVTCRLTLSEAGYMALKEKTIYTAQLV
ncbi:uncharacterized protein [Epargyreus clarus]|uniref:uncharacterized protein n=1 Tax=Epargyreus clarus TaxID=520877 RepID=UPI003C2B2D3D